jgi:hypothetical protein
MKKTLHLAIGLSAMTLLAVSAARAQSIYSTPYTFTTIAGKAGSHGSADGTNSAAQFYWPTGIAEDAQGNLYVVDRNENTVRKITPAGTNWVVTTIAGTAGPSSSDADGTNGAAVFYDPVGIAADARGNLYVAENNGSTLRKIAPVGTNWVVTTIAGQSGNYSFADGTNGAALFNGPQNVTVDTNGNLYVADSFNSVIRKVTPVGTNWVVTTIAGQPGQPGYADGTNNQASFDIPYGLARDAAGNLYVSDDPLVFAGSTLRKITPVGTNWVVRTIAGSAAASGSADGMNNAALFNSPLSIALDSAGNLLVADYGNATIRKVTPAGTNWIVSTIAGTNGTTSSADGTGASAHFVKPWGATVDSAGNLYVTDFADATIRLGRNTAPPNLMAVFAAPAGVVVSWTGAGGFALQTNRDLTTTNWANYGGTITTNNGLNNAAITPLPGNLFFRLKQ